MGDSGTIYSVPLEQDKEGNFIRFPVGLLAELAAAGWRDGDKLERQLERCTALLINRSFGNRLPEPREDADLAIEISIPE